MPVAVTVPVIGGVSVKVAAVTVAGLTGSLKVAVRATDVDTLVAPPVGLVIITVGGVVSVAVPVVKDQT